MSDACPTRKVRTERDNALPGQGAMAVTTHGTETSATLASRMLVLVKHAAPAIEPQVAAARWRLTADGRAA